MVSCVETLRQVQWSGKWTYRLAKVFPKTALCQAATRWMASDGVDLIIDQGHKGPAAALTWHRFLFKAVFHKLDDLSILVRIRAVVIRLPQPLGQTPDWTPGRLTRLNRLIPTRVAIAFLVGVVDVAIFLEEIDIGAVLFLSVERLPGVPEARVDVSQSLWGCGAHWRGHFELPLRLLPGHGGLDSGGWVPRHRAATERRCEESELQERRSGCSTRARGVRRERDGYQEFQANEEEKCWLGLDVWLSGGGGEAPRYRHPERYPMLVAPKCWTIRGR